MEVSTDSLALDPIIITSLVRDPANASERQRRAGDDHQLRY